jgi:hypothetical protein
MAQNKNSNTHIIERMRKKKADQNIGLKRTLKTLKQQKQTEEYQPEKMKPFLK